MSTVPLIHTKDKVNPMAQMLCDIFGLKLLTHNPDEVVVVHGPVWQEHGVLLHKSLVVVTDLLVA